MMKRTLVGLVVFGMIAAGLIGMSAAGLVRLPAAQAATGYALDTTFETNVIDSGLFDSEAYRVVVQSDGKIVVAGGYNAPRLARFNADGTPDTEFNTNIGGYLSVGSEGGAEVYALALRPSDAHIVVAGGSLNGSDWTIVVVNPDGTRDTTFDPADAATLQDGQVESLAFSGSTLLAGGYFTGMIAAFNATTGVRDTSFSLDTLPGTAVGSMSVVSLTTDSAGNIYAGGYNFTQGNGVVQYSPTGVLDTTFSTNNPSLPAPYNSAQALSLAIQTVGGTEYLLVGGFNLGRETGQLEKLQRLALDGTLDPTFATGSAQPGGDISKVIPRPGGKILAGGQFTSPSGAFAQYNSDGSLDAAFATALGSSASGFEFYDFDVASNGDVVLAAYESPSLAKVARITAPSGGGGTLSATTTATQASASSIAWGSSITDTATVTGTAGSSPTGTVSFYTCYNAATPVTSCTSTATPQGSAKTLTSSGTNTATASVSVSGLTPGYYMFYATYSGDSTFAASTESGTNTTEKFQVTKATPTVTTNPSQGVAPGGSLTVSASLTPVACASDGSPTITFTVTGDPTTGGTGAYTLGTVAASTGSWNGLTTGWLPGVYALTATFNGSTNCNTSPSDGLTMITVAVTTPGSAWGGGWSNVGGNAKQNVGFEVQTFPKSATTPATTKGQVQWNQKYAWKFKGTLTAYQSAQTCKTGTTTINTCAKATGTGALYQWTGTGASGKWVLQSSSASVTVLSSATTPSTKKSSGSPGYFGIGFTGATGAPAPPTSTTALNALNGGTIKIN